jgi:hemolysin activation/secretion protein
MSAIPLAAIPPPVPSAGVVEREIEKEYEGHALLPHKDVPAIRLDIPKEKLKLPKGKKIFVGKIEIHGNRAIEKHEIMKWIHGHLDRKMSLKDIYELCEKIDHRYAEKGYFLARAYPPAQKVKKKKGVLRIEILEGKLGEIKIVGNKHYSKSFIRGYFKPLAKKPLQYDEFLRALLLLNDNSDLEAGAVFEKSRKFGCADVILNVKDKRPLHLYLNGNNYGRDLTTNARVGGRLDWGSAIKEGDKFSVAEVVGFPIDALYFTDVRYIIPLNRKGTSLEVAYLFSKFKIEELRNLGLRGRSDIGTIKLNQAYIRKRFVSVDLFTAFDFKQIQNFVFERRSSFDKLRVLSFGGVLDHFIPDQGRDNLTVRISTGIPDFLGGLNVVSRESSRIGGGGCFIKLNADYDRIQVIPKDCFFYFHASGQLSPNKLTLPEQIYIGGSDTVRGFPLAVALGDTGYYLNFEFRSPLPFLANKNFFNLKKKWKEILQLTAFLDQGGTFLNEGRSTLLWGTGAGVRIYGPYTLTLSLDVGVPLNHRDLTKDVFLYIKLTGQPF